MALEDSYRTYRDVIAAAIHISRPGVEIECVELDALEEKLRDFDPLVVICSLPLTVDRHEAPGWVELSLDLGHPTRVTIKGHHVEQSNRMGLEQLLNVLDEVEQLTRHD
ncbi:MAG TPA: hypothetical protein VJ827_13080 [Rubrobacter sp.]|nr:hypothetical protein [Rubrobacter sp.]